MRSARMKPFEAPAAMSVSGYCLKPPGESVSSTEPVAGEPSPERNVRRILTSASPAFWMATFVRSDAF